MRKLVNRLKQTLVILAIALLIWGMWLVAFGPWLWQVNAQATGSWLSANPVLGQREELGTSQQPESIASAGNIPCSQVNFTLKPAIPPLQASQTAQACAVMTPQGKTAPGGYTNIFKTDARVYNSGGGAVNFYPIPGVVGGLVLENTAQGIRVHYYSSGLQSARKEFNQATREMKVYLPANPSWTLKDGSGKILYVRPESIAFSGNGQWMVADSEFLAMIRVNLATGEVLPFGSPYVYHLGFSVMPNLAVSDDGQTVVATSDRGDFKITNLASCAPAPNVITGPVTCSSTSHEAFIRSQIAGYHRIYQPRFVSDRRLSFYASYNNSPTTRVLAKFRLAPAGESLESQDYLALGDSFASGEGAYDYFPETDTQANKCHLSRQSYPYLIGQQLGLGSYNSVACSGAKIQDITSYAQRQNIPSPNNMGRLLPGYKKQNQYVREQNPNVLTIGIGGNDAGLLTRLRACMKIGTCYQDYEDRLEIIREINAQFPRLVDLYTQLKREARTSSKLYVVGYPRAVKEGGTCGLNVLLDDQELLFANQLIDYLNRIIELSAQKAGVRYVDVATAFYGYRLCETDGSKAAFNGLTLGDDAPFPFGPIGNESFHPNKLGHQLYRQKILEQTGNFTQAMPVANPGVQLPAENSGLALLQAPKTNRAINETVNDDTIAEDTIYSKAVVAVAADHQQHLLEPSSEVSIELHSESTLLGKFKADEKGGVRASVTIPEDLPAGFHTLHIFGRTILGNSIDIYKTVHLVRASPPANQSTSKQKPTGPATEQDQVSTSAASTPGEIHQTASQGQPSQPTQSKAKLGAWSNHILPAKLRGRPAVFAPVLLMVFWVLVYVYKRRRMR